MNDMLPVNDILLDSNISFDHYIFNILDPDLHFRND